MMIGGKGVESKTIKVITDSGFQMSDASLKRCHDVAMELDDLQRRGLEVTNALNPIFMQMTELASKAPLRPHILISCARPVYETVVPALLRSVLRLSTALWSWHRPTS